MEIKQFRKKYDLELIAASHEGIINGSLVWDAIIGKPKFDHPGMPNHILNAFVDADLISMDEFTEMYAEFGNIDLTDAFLGISQVNTDIEVANEIAYPKIGELAQSLNLSSTKKFAFGELKVKSMPDLIKIQLDDLIEEMKANKWKDYDSKIRRVFMITELYYGSIKIQLEKRIENEVDAKIAALNLGVSNKVKINKNIEYTFDSTNVPFAMRIERVKTFNG